MSDSTSHTNRSDGTPDDHAATTRIDPETREPGQSTVPPPRLGRYEIRSMLGTGGFADVYLAFDEELDREVALKVPRTDSFTDDEALQQVANEARMAAGLQHPGIVPVFDVGTDEGTPYIVLQYVRGRSLDHLVKHETPSYTGAAQLTADVAVALAFAHDQGFVHRDIKPRNILLDRDDRPLITDFGLAVRHRDLTGTSDEIAGTTRYMSPEQVRGENHRIDGRTDIWALGVVLYQLLTGRQPFGGETSDNVFHRILNEAPVPPRQIDAAIPEELERICLRCLCRQMSERYRTATDLADDLFEWLQQVQGDSGVSGGSSFRRRARVVETPEVAVIPRGLRSFGREDVDFFLRLVPGPRDRDGLPVSLQFWKRRIEEREPDDTFRVGLLYGPSGCGKSSLVKAGLLPRLHADVVCIYVESTAEDTESKLLRQLRRKFPGLPERASLTDALQQLREDSKLRGRSKVLVVLDQFEQCLHAGGADPSGELLRGLRHCDGGNVQCLLMIRDDYWLAVSRFMSQLEISIVDGENAMLVDSFDPDHAQSVLRAFGVAYQRLPENAADQTEQQTSFLERATTELAEDGRLYPVRLAVFVEMVRDRVWEPETLARMGGVEGVGVAFLENSVGSQASPARRVHEQAARNVLAALLPAAGRIKGPVRTHSELLEASGYARRPRAFDELLHLLDVELRLLTPAGAVGDESSRDAGDSETSQSQQETTYQLTHDFLVPSIREWLERQLRGTRGGRLRLLLEEQADLWNGRRSPRYLPSLVEWAGISIFTNRREWSEPQRTMMRAVTRRIVGQASLTVSVLLLVSLIGWGVYRNSERDRQQRYAGDLCSRLQDVEMADVPGIIAEMGEYREWTDPRLHTELSDTSQDGRRRIRAALALLPSEDRHVEWLVEQLISARVPPEDFLVIRGVLQPYGDRVAVTLRAALEDEVQPPHVRLRVACALAAFDTTPETWEQLDHEVVNSLLREPGTDARVWIEALRPVSNELRQPLKAELRRSRTLESARIGALAIFDFDNEQVDGLTDLLVDAEGPQFRAIVELLRGAGDSLAALHDQVKQINQDDPEYVADPGLYARRRANVVLAIYELGDRSLLSQDSVLTSNPQVRTRLIHGMNPEQMDVAALVPLILDPHDNKSLRNVAMAAIWRHRHEPLSRDTRDRLSSYLDEASLSPNRETHALVELLLKSQGMNIAEPDAPLLRDNVENEDCQWATNGAGQTMILLDPTRAVPDGDTAPAELNYRFAISAHEVTYKLFQEYSREHTQNEMLQVDADDVPATNVLMVQIAGFCNWLSRRDGLNSSQWCYPPASELNVANCDPVPDFLTKSGYRIPTTLEWKFACQTGAGSLRFYGDDPDLMQYYGWSRTHSGQRLQRVGQLLPNPFGLFDVYGNAAEMCIAHPEPGQPITYYVCGDNSLVTANRMTSESTQLVDHRSRGQFQGFRVAVTLTD